MHLEGSCHCRAVRFSLEADSPVPFMHCHCSICRKTAGGGGYAINLGGDARTLKVQGARHLGTYHAVMREEGQRARRSKAERKFCLQCGSALWLWDPRWPELVHPHASAIDTPCPSPRSWSKACSNLWPTGSMCPRARATGTTRRFQPNHWPSGMSGMG